MHPRAKLDEYLLNEIDLDIYYLIKPYSLSYKFFICKNGNNI